MASRKIFKGFRWKLFFPMLGTMWFVVAALSYVQYRSITDFNVQHINRQMLSVASDILQFYENNESPRSYMTFLNSFASGTLLERMRVSVYERERLSYSRGQSIPISMVNKELRREDRRNHYAAMRSNNGEILVLVAVPSTAIRNVDGPTRTFWVTVAILLILCILVCFLLSSLVTRNIQVLRKFAERAASGQVEFDESRFSHDELGDISRQIVRLYTDKSRALASNKREHEMAMYAVEEKSRIKRQLTNNINHEIKTPVGVIRGYLDTVMNSPDMDDKTRNLFLTRAHSNVIRLCDLLNDVSTMTRLEESGANIQTLAIDFHDLVFGIETDMSASGTLGDFEFDTDIPLDCTVKGNTNLLTGVVTNLIRNAVQHSRGSRISLRMIIESDKFYTFTFSDNGTGVDEVHLPHLFERFYRVDAGRSRKAGGTGLGLPIVKNAIEAMGGSITVQNHSTGGLQFIFTLEKFNRVKKS